jgi:hypothetical protein
VASGEHGSHVLADAVELQESRRVSEAEVASPSTALVHEKRPSVCFEDTTVKFDGIQIITDLPKNGSSGEERGGRSSSLLTQFLLLYVRNVHILTRDYVSNFFITLSGVFLPTETFFATAFDGKFAPASECFLERIHFLKSWAELSTVCRALTILSYAGRQTSFFLRKSFFANGAICIPQTPITLVSRSEPRVVYDR